MFIKLSEAEPGSVLYKHLEKRIEESEFDRQTLRAKSGRFEV
jgi:hypothetical protein